MPLVSLYTPKNFRKPGFLKVLASTQRDQWYELGQSETIRTYLS